MIIVVEPLKTCKVSCFDLKEVKHTVEVSAGSVYKAVAQALRIFRDNNWVEDIGHGQTPITVKVKHPEMSIRFACRTSSGGWKPAPAHPPR
jgi:hypothetical protein